MGSLKITQMFAFVPPPSAPAPSPILNSCQNEEKRRKGQRKREETKKSDLYLQKTIEKRYRPLLHSRYKMASVNDGQLLKGNNSTLATSTANPDTNNREERRNNV